MRQATRDRNRDFPDGEAEVLFDDDDLDLVKWDDICKLSS